MQKTNDTPAKGTKTHHNLPFELPVIGVTTGNCCAMTAGEFMDRFAGGYESNERRDAQGFVVYSSPSEAESRYEWVPLERFLKSYFILSTCDKITKDDVTRFIANVETSTLGAKTTTVLATLINGFELAATSACVDPENYDEQIGRIYAMGDVEDALFQLLGFLLQCARFGFAKCSHGENHRKTTVD